MALLYKEFVWEIHRSYGIVQNKELYIERNTEKLNLARIVLKRLQTPWKQKLYTQQEKVSRFYYFSPYFELFCRIDVFPIQTLIITPLRNVMLTVTRELGLPVVRHC